MKTNFTPGPWKVSTSAVYDQVNASDESLICFSAMKENSKANAALIAAAPEMFEALSYLFEQIDNNDASITMHGVHTEWYDKARAALAKAKGGS